MATTLRLKNIPDELYRRLKESAASNRRSLNSEVIVRLESVLVPGRVTVSERLSRACALRASLPNMNFGAEEIDEFKREGQK